MHELVSYRRFGRVRSLRNDRTERTLGCYVATELGSSSRPSLARARSLHSDRAERTLGRYIATELGSSSVGRTCIQIGRGQARVWKSDRGQAKLDRYAVTKHARSSVATDRAGQTLGRYVATELRACLVTAYRSSLACLRSDFHTRACPRPIWIHVRCLRTIGI
ncbi:hypothetical protein IGI04_036392 [Brassica rapa subsp. trilocularis]|uniref:Uncharacterized protein n=1 Tax=Brassica rapa subsp. trilocularis TaxID=1813537 RepID=A0ABQ7LED0_BRACM|nr:hypothetical protein IGI04_036392 [Brassica rapa subsp. trilocularis]